MSEQRIQIIVVTVLVTAGFLTGHHLYLKEEQLQVEKAKIEEQRKAESKIEKLRTIIHNITKDKTP